MNPPPDGLRGKHFPLPLPRRTFLGAMAALAVPTAVGAQGLSQQRLRIATATEPSSFDPHFTYFGPNRQAHMPVFEPLVMYAADLSLKPALATIMAFVGAKMVLIDVVKVPPVVSLGVIAGVLTIAILASWRVQKNAPVEAGESDPAGAARPPSPLPGD